MCELCSPAETDRRTITQAYRIVRTLARICIKKPARICIKKLRSIARAVRRTITQAYRIVRTLARICIKKPARICIKKLRSIARAVRRTITQAYRIVRTLARICIKKPARICIKKLRSIARAVRRTARTVRRTTTRAFRKTRRLGHTGIKLALSRAAWRIFLGHAVFVVLNRSNPEATRLATRIRHATGNLSTKMLFLLGNFGAAMEQAMVDLECRPDDVETRMLVVGCAIELGDFQCAEHQLNLLDADRTPDHLKEQVALFRYTLTRATTPEDLEHAFRHLDDLFLSMGCRPIRVSPTCNGGVFDSLSSVATTADHCQDGYRPLCDGPLVSVIMTAYNVEHLAQTSVMSILNQNYCNLELIVVDDCSTDGTLEALRLMEREDERIRIIAKDRNDGTYISKNIGLLRAQGEFVAFQDSDDWSHPDRVGKSIAVLESEPEIAALMTSWIRMTTEGTFVLRAQNRYSYKACISLVFRRREILKRSGFFDSVRAEGDSEFEKRIGILFGNNRIVHYPWLLSFGRVRAESITANAEFGLTRSGGRPAREKYRKAYRKWHKSIGRGQDGYMPFPLRERPFVAPSAILAESQ